MCLHHIRDYAGHCPVEWVPMYPVGHGRRRVTEGDDITLLSFIFVRTTSTLNSGTGRVKYGDSHVHPMGQTRLTVCLTTQPTVFMRFYRPSGAAPVYRYTHGVCSKNSSQRRAMP